MWLVATLLDSAGLEKWKEAYLTGHVGGNKPPPPRCARPNPWKRCYVMWQRGLKEADGTEVADWLTLR